MPPADDFDEGTYGEGNYSGYDVSYDANNPNELTRKLDIGGVAAAARPGYVDDRKSPFYQPKEHYLVNAKSEDNLGYNDADREKIRQQSGKWIDEVRDNANTDATRNKMDPHWKDNHAKDNWRGNLNGKSYNSTLRLSRAADAMNNARHWDPGLGGRRTNSGFGTNEMTEAKSERWEPIETQEMRQMRANERMDEQQRTYDIKRAAGVLDYGMELEKLNSQQKAEIAKLITQEDLSVDQALRIVLGQTDMEMPAALHYKMKESAHQRYMDAMRAQIRYNRLQSAWSDLMNERISPDQFGAIANMLGVNVENMMQSGNTFSNEWKMGPNEYETKGVGYQSVEQ